jgi:hypothetical protein
MRAFEAGRDAGSAPSLRPAAWRAETARASRKEEVQDVAERRMRGRKEGSKGMLRQSPTAGGAIGLAWWCSYIATTGVRAGAARGWRIGGFWILDWD